MRAQQKQSHAHARGRQGFIGFLTAALISLPLAAAWAVPDHATGPERAEEKRADAAEQNDPPKAEPAQRSEQQSSPAHASNDEAPPETSGNDENAVRQDNGDPPGNNGTVKIDGIPFDDHPDNEPHPGCVFQIDFYGYDEGDLSATYSLELHAPTGSTMLEDGMLDIGEDPAGGGTDLDASVTVDLSDELANSGVAAHEQQGYHVRLTVHAEGSIGADVKHKMFWVECEAEVGGGGEGGPPTGVGGIQDERDEVEAEVLGVQFQRDVAVEGLAMTGVPIAGALILGPMAIVGGLVLRGATRRRR